MTWQPPTHRPFLCATPERLAEAKHKIARGFAPAVAAFREVERLASDAQEVTLPDFDHTWFAGTSMEDWAAIYPQVYRDTWATPNLLAAPCLGAALHYSLAGNTNSLAAARRSLHHFCQNYAFDIEHYDAGMNYAGWGMPLLYAYDVLHDHLTPSERNELDAFFAAWNRAITMSDKQWIEHQFGGAYNNHYAWHKQAMGTYGLHVGRADFVHEAIWGPMGFADLYSHALTDDGLWFESSTGYHFVANVATMPFAQSLRYAGWPEDLFTMRFDKGMGVPDLYSAMLGMLLPDGEPPSVGDCYGRPVQLPAVQYEYAYASTPDPGYAWVLGRSERHHSGLGVLAGLFVAKELADQSEPQVVSRLWREHGYALLVHPGANGYFSQDSAACFATYGYSGIHGNADKLSFQLYADGVHWLVDAEASSTGHSFSSDVQRELNRTTVPHNLIAIDSTAQRGLQENLRVAAFAPDEGRLTLVDEGALYPGVHQERTLLLEASRLADTYRVTGYEAHTYDYQLHFAPDVELDLPLELVPCPPLGEAREYQWLRNTVSAKIQDTEFAFVARLGHKALRIRAVLPEHTTLIRADFPRTQTFDPPHLPMLVFRTHAYDATFRVWFEWG